MNNNPYDYKKTDFKIINDSEKKSYFIKIKNNFIEVDEKIYKICKSSYHKLYHTYHQEVAKSVLHFGDFDLATSFYLQNNESVLNKIVLKEIAEIIYNEIDNLKETDKTIAILFFIYEYNISEIAKKLHIPRKTVEYRKNKIRKFLQQKVKNYCHFDK